MLVVVRIFRHTTPMVVEVFEKCDGQSQRDAQELASILSRKDKCEYKVMIDITCTDL